MRVILLLALGSIPWPATALAQSTWYVDASATAPGDGSPSAPFTTIQQAVSHTATVSGDTVLVAPGSYAGFGTNGKRLHIQSTAGVDATTIVGFVALDAGSPSAGTPILEGFTIVGDGVALWSSWIRRCVVIGDGSIGSRGVHLADGPNRVLECTIVGFRSGIYENAFNGGQGQLVENCALRNTHDFDGLGSGGTATGIVRYCCYSTATNLQPGWTFQNNVVGAPGFFDVPPFPYRLASGSPCIDAGNPAQTDPDGSLIDIGAYAFDANYTPVPTTYCVGKLNGQGCVPVIDATGICSATSGAPFLVSATLVSTHKFGRLFYGFAPAAIPFVGGTKCIAAPTRRTALVDSGGNGQPCSGGYAFDFAARVRSGVDAALLPGQMVHAQFWYRDPADPAGFGIGLTNAVKFVIAP